MTKLRKPIYLRYSLGGSRPRQTTKFRRSSNILKNVLFECQDKIFDCISLQEAFVKKK